MLSKALSLSLLWDALPYFSFEMDLVLLNPKSILYVLQKFLEISWLWRKRKYKNRGHRLLGRALDGYLQDELFMGSPVHSTLIQGCCLKVFVLVFNRFTVLETHVSASHGRDVSRFSLYSSLTWLTGLLEQLAQGSCEVPILADVKRLNGYGPQPPAAPVYSGLNMGVGPCTGTFSRDAFCSHWLSELWSGVTMSTVKS